MHLWEIRNDDRTLWARGSNWLVATGYALDQLGLAAHQIAGLIVEESKSGTIRARTVHAEPARNLRLMIRPVNATRSLIDEDEPTESVDLLALHQPAEPTLEEETVRLGSVSDERSSDGPTMLVEPPTALPEKIFELGQEIALAENLEAAAKQALTILREFVPVRSGTVLYASMDDVDLRFLAAQGPGTEQLAGLRVPFGQGVAGWCFQTGEAVLVRDVDSAEVPVHDSDLPGAKRGALLATPIVDERGQTYGCIELQHPENRFKPWHVDAARVIANQLALYFRAWSGDPY